MSHCAPLIEGQRVVVDDPDLADFYALGAKSTILAFGSKIIVMTIDPSAPRGPDRVLDVDRYDPSIVKAAQRTWHMFADLAEQHDGGTFWRDVYDHPIGVEMSGGTPVPVVLTEDPDGEYLGWLDVRDGLLDESRVALVQQEYVFPVQFPYGVQAEVDKGKGQVVRVRIDRAEEPSSGATLANL